MKEYIKVKENSQGITDLEVEVYYSLGGENCFTYKSEPRGYYLSVSPIERRGNMISFVAFSGVKKCIKPVKRKSAKAESEAEKIAETEKSALIDYILKKSGLALAEN